ncbi:hypothetical protein KAFR_0H03770 [Kazachstania africana CBS 2517]|uniref:Enoyl reductase (ER) domain-containing protein n=1 Tax=Kazachstania africana (strain ATCC 22294 / BCRC 22015 / CBS 2517 / CECT 1963 / NBRC 1671 / NRRL Y-8276) TaxID=1071382 RepID=H2AYL0_KAZAF|nr:hypothetical protein KAFR_0H03770 [Kazachstania africana CBS 2517]CCF59787.1 hypothetical protein KAFR_0H03770 [Kazachstania africana CBS 2517]
MKSWIKMSYPEKFQGIGIVDTKDWTHPKRVTYEPKAFGPHDVDIEIECCGVCGSDIHTAASHWRELRDKMVVGHEIVGRIVKLGPECDSGLKIGDRVGVGAQSFSCLECDRCKENNEPYCPKFVSTYNRPYDDGYISQGGYASHVRLHEHFAIPVPDEIPSELAAPLMCGGITVFSPLLRNGCGPNKKLASSVLVVLGIWAYCLLRQVGAEVYAFSRTNSKREDSVNLGADHYIATMEEKDWEEKYYNTLDLVVVCASSLTEINFDKFVKVMKIGGTIISIAAPHKDQKLVLAPLGLLGVKIGNSGIGSVMEIKTMLDLVAKNNIKIWVETVPISEKGVTEVFERMEKGDVRYRFTLVDYDKEFK